MKMTKVQFSADANIAGVVITLRQAGFTAWTETLDRAEWLFTDATLAEAILTFGHSNWVAR